MYYILDENKNPVPCELMVWAEWFETLEDRRVAKSIVNGKRISTVFLGLDHGDFMEGEPNHKPAIFETMVFPAEGMLDIYCQRYSTWQEAEEGHQRAVQWVLDGCKDDE